MTVEVRRETDELGTSLWVYEVVPGKEEEPLRECTWWFAEEGEGWAVDVRAMAVCFGFTCFGVSSAVLTYGLLGTAGGEGECSGSGGAGCQLFWGGSGDKVKKALVISP